MTPEEVVNAVSTAIEHGRLDLTDPIEVEAADAHDAAVTHVYRVTAITIDGGHVWLEFDRTDTL